MSASIRHDAELMQNYVPAASVIATGQHKAMLDPSTRRPVVLAFSGDSPPKLQLFQVSR